ncbi:MAG: hypothetical protein ABT940_01675 [Alphaproteobacteria bacterium]
MSEAEKSAGWIYVARSAKLSKWGGDVGVGKHVFKVGCTTEAVEPLVRAGFAGETDWKVVGKLSVEDVDEEAMLARVARKLKIIDPVLYPKLKGTPGIVKVTPASVENHLLLTLALANRDLQGVKVAPGDYGTYLIHVATGSPPPS